MDKTEWPTESRLEELRNEGKVAYSSSATRLLSAVGVICALVLGAGSLQDFLDHYPKFIEQGASVEQLLGYVWVVLSPLLIGVAVAALLICLVAGLFQTKMLFISSRLTVDLSRLNNFSLPSLPRLLKRITHSSLTLLLSLGVGLGCLWLSIRSTLELTHQTPQQLEVWLTQEILAYIPLLIGVLVVFALVFWLLGKWRFAMVHRMSRQEVERESWD